MGEWDVPMRAQAACVGGGIDVVEIERGGLHLCTRPGACVRAHACVRHPRMRACVPMLRAPMPRVRRRRAWTATQPSARRRWTAASASATRVRGF